MSVGEDLLINIRIEILYIFFLLGNIFIKILYNIKIPPWMFLRIIRIMACNIYNFKCLILYLDTIIYILNKKFKNIAKFWYCKEFLNRRFFCYVKIDIDYTVDNFDADNVSLLHMRHAFFFKSPSNYFYKN